MAHSTQLGLVEHGQFNHKFTGQAWSSKRITSIVHILLPESVKAYVDCEDPVHACAV